MKLKDDLLLPMSELKKRGWTEALITRFLGAPDELRTNPHYKSGGAMRLYKRERVEQAETSEEFHQAQEGRKGRQEAARKALATKMKKIKEHVATIKIAVPRLGKDELIRRACDHYNARNRNGADKATQHSDPVFLVRICVNYLRHRQTQYEKHLRQIAGKVGVHEAYLDIKKKVLEAIGEEYDWLSDECDQQAMWA